MISSPGVGSGLDVRSIVDQLMAIERRPLDRLQADKRSFETQLSTLGTLKSTLSTFQGTLASLKTLNAFEIYTAVSSNEAAFTATADSNAAVSTSTIQVNKLALAHKMGSVAIADTDTTTLGGAGDQITLTVAGNAFTVNGGGLTLNQLRDAINDAPDNTGVSATIITETTGSNRLVLTSTETGNVNAMSLSFTGSLGTALGLTDITDPTQLDSDILLDGLYTITRPGNTISDAISGVTLNLTGVSTTPDGLSISRDIDAVKASVQSFVDEFNELRTITKGMAGTGSALDTTLRSIESQMRSVFNTAPTGLTTAFTYLTEVGVTFQRDGSLALDAAGLEAAIATDFAGVAELFANDNEGYMFRLDSVVNDFINFDGLLKTREDSINDRVRSVEDRIFTMEFRLDLREQSLLDQFNRLDSLMGQLQGTSAFLTQQLAALPTISTGRN